MLRVLPGANRGGDNPLTGNEKEAAGQPMFTWKLAIKTACVCWVFEWRVIIIVLHDACTDSGRQLAVRRCGSLGQQRSFTEKSDVCVGHR